MRTRTRWTFSAMPLWLLGCQPATMQVGRVDGTTTQDGAGDEIDDDAYETEPTVTVTSTFGTDGEDGGDTGAPGACPGEAPPQGRPRPFTFARVDGAPTGSGTSMCTVKPGYAFRFDCVGDLDGEFLFEYGVVPGDLFLDDATSELTYFRAENPETGVTSEWIRMTKDGFVMVLVQAEGLAPPHMTTDEWLAGFFAGPEDGSECAAVACEDGMGGSVRHQRIWLGTTEDPSAAKSVSITPLDSGVVGPDDAWYELGLSVGRVGGCGPQPDGAAPQSWYVYGFEGPFPGG